MKTGKDALLLLVFIPNVISIHIMDISLELRGLLPHQPGMAVELGVFVGKQDHLPARFIMICLDDEVTKKRQEKIEKEAKDDGRRASPEQLELARWLLY